VSVPHLVAYPAFALASQMGLYRFPKHLIDYFRYPTIISDKTFREEMGFAPGVTTMEALRSIRHG
jgi:hypothetical protein